MNEEEARPVSRRRKKQKRIPQAELSVPATEQAQAEEETRMMLEENLRDLMKDRGVSWEEATAARGPSGKPWTFWGSLLDTKDRAEYDKWLLEGVKGVGEGFVGLFDPRNLQALLDPNVAIKSGQEWYQREWPKIQAQGPYTYALSHAPRFVGQLGGQALAGKAMFLRPAAPLEGELLPAEAAQRRGLPSPTIDIAGTGGRGVGEEALARPVPGPPSPQPTEGWPVPTGRGTGVDINSLLGGADFARTPEGRTIMGVNRARLGRVLAGNLYKGESSGVITKELIQNAQDAVRQSPNKDIFLNVKDSVQGSTGIIPASITVRDTGIGMTRDDIDFRFTDLGETGKEEQEETTGELGIAKASFLLMGDHADVTTIAREADGKLYQHSFTATPDELLGDKGFVTYSKPMPEGTMTGTTIKVTLPAEMTTYAAHRFAARSGRSIRSPGKIHLESGTLDVVPQDIVKFYSGSVPGADFDIYRSQGNELDKLVNEMTGSVSAEIHSEGLYQLDHTVWLPDQIPGSRLPKRLVVDVHPTVKGTHKQYPFLANREEVSEDVIKAVNKGVIDEIVKPAMARYKTLAHEVYESMPTIRGTNMPVYDAGSRLTQEELTQILSDPMVINIAKTMQRVHSRIAELIRKAVMPWQYQEMGKRTRSFGLVLSKDVHGLNMPHPDDKNIRTILVNPFTDVANSTPGQTAVSKLHAIVHEIVHDAVHGHYDNFTTGEVVAYHAVGDAIIDLIKELREVYGNAALRAGFGRALSLYEQSRARPQLTGDILGGEELRTGQPPSGAGGYGEGVGGLRGGREGAVPTSQLETPAQPEGGTGLGIPLPAPSLADWINQWLSKL